MHPLLKKMNYKGQEKIYWLNAPKDLDVIGAEWKKELDIKTRLSSRGALAYVVVFATQQKEVDSYTDKIAPRLMDDAQLWFCYPKKSSKKYSCEFNRDTGWQIMGKHDLEPVRMVAVDADWSALRFRHVDKIKTLTRSKKMALSKKAKDRTTGK